MSAARRALRRAIAARPALYLPLARRLGKGANVVTVDTDIVIEGFPRSANTYAEVGFRYAQGTARPIIAHHCHAAAQLVFAAKRGIPSMCIVRQPRDAVLSLVQFSDGRVSLEEALRDYVAFHEPLLARRERLGVFTFEAVTAGLGNCTRALNEAFGTAFVPLGEGEEEARSVRASMLELSVARGRSGLGGIHYLAPADESMRRAREAWQARLDEELHTRPNAAWLARAEAIRVQLLEVALR